MNNVGNSKEPVYENRAYGIHSVQTKNDNAYIEYGDDKRREDRTCSREDSWWYLCLACLMCR